MDWASSRLRAKYLVGYLSSMYPERYSANYDDPENARYRLQDYIFMTAGFTWLDTGTFQSLVEATNFVRTVEDHQGIKIAAPEEIAYLNGWITCDQLRECGEKLSKSEKGQTIVLESSTYPGTTREV